MERCGAIYIYIYCAHAQHVYSFVCMCLRLPLLYCDMKSTSFFSCSTVRNTKSSHLYTYKCVCTYFIYAEPTLVGLFVCSQNKGKRVVVYYECMRWSDSYKYGRIHTVQHALLMKCVEKMEMCRTYSKTEVLSDFWATQHLLNFLFCLSFSIFNTSFTLFHINLHRKWWRKRRSRRRKEIVTQTAIYVVYVSVALSTFKVCQTV